MKIYFYFAIQYICLIKIKLNVLERKEDINPNIKAIIPHLFKKHSIPILLF